MDLVTTATGQVGSIVVDELSRRNIAARAMARDLAKARKFPGISWVQGAFDDPPGNGCGTRGNRCHVPCLCRRPLPGRPREPGDRRGAAQ